MLFVFLLLLPFFSPHFAFLASPSLPSYSCLFFPALSTPLFSATLTSPVASSSAIFFLRLSPLTFPRYSLSLLFLRSLRLFALSLSLASPIRPVHSFAPSVPTFASSVSSLASPVVTVTTSFPSSLLACSFSFLLLGMFVLVRWVPLSALMWFLLFLLYFLLNLPLFPLWILQFLLFLHSSLLFPLLFSLFLLFLGFLTPLFLLRLLLPLPLVLRARVSLDFQPDTLDTSVFLMMVCIILMVMFICLRTIPTRLLSTRLHFLIGSKR